MDETNFGFQSRIDFTELNSSVSAIKNELGKVIIGQQQVIELLLCAVFADGHVLIEGVPGIAKTLIAKLLSRTLAVDFKRIQFTPDLMPSDIIGTAVFHPAKASFEFRKGPLFSNIVLIDEINRAPAKTQSALFEVMEERQITVDGTTYELAKPFMVLATQNPIEHEGTYRLPEAQLDRFIFKVLVKYPTVQEEILILEGHHQRKESNPAAINVSEILNAKKIEQLRNQIRLVHVEKKLMDYIAALVTQTRNDKSLYLGASPRASVSLLNASKALAALRNRDFITPEDVQELAYPVMRHRIMLTPEKEMEGITADDVIKQIVQRVEVPR